MSNWGSFRMIIAEEKDETIILIPSLEPDDRLLSYVRQLRDYGFMNLVIVDDGSGEKYQHIFEELEDNGCSLLRHAQNQGKGEALKTGFRYIAQHYGQAHYVVTADSDGLTRCRGCVSDCSGSQTSSE